MYTSKEIFTQIRNCIHECVNMTELCSWAEDIELSSAGVWVVNTWAWRIQKDCSVIKNQPQFMWVEKIQYVQPHLRKSAILFCRFLFSSVWKSCVLSHFNTCVRNRNNIGNMIQNSVPFPSSSSSSFILITLSHIHLIEPSTSTFQRIRVFKCEHKRNSC